MNFPSEEILEYIKRLSPEEPELLKKLDRETNLNVIMPTMLTGHVQGRFLSFMSRMIRPSRVLEVGTYTGYSAICFAEGLAEGGVIHTLDINEELEEIALRYFKEAGLQDIIHRMQGNALEIIPALDGKYDLIFLDADKENYPNYLPMLKEKLSANGLLMVDNTLWSGKVLDPSHTGDKETQGIQKLNELVSKDPDLESFLLPLRDGVTLIRWR
jgi:predicted O-methyltransferase YrrM